MSRKLWPKELFKAVQRDEDGDEVYSDDETRAILRRLKDGNWLKPLPKRSEWKICPALGLVVPDDHKYSTYKGGHPVVTVRKVC